MVDYALGQGIGTGISSFMDAYMKAKQMKDTEALRNKQLKLSQAQAGIVDFDEQGNPIYTPEKKSKLELERGLLDPSSPQSKKIQDVQLGLLSAANPELIPKLEPIIRQQSGADLQKDTAGIKGLISGEYGIRRMAGLSGPREKQVKISEAKLAQDAGKDFDKNNIIQTSQKAINNIDRAIGVGEGKAVMNPQIFAALQQDYINAMAPGGAATEGKMNREIVETINGQLQELMQKYRGNVTDFRKDNPVVFKNLMDNIKQTREEWKNAQRDQLLKTKANYDETEYSSVKNTVKKKIGEYDPELYEELYKEKYIRPGAGLLKGNKEQKVSSKSTDQILSEEDKKAIEWAKQNKDKPEAKEIMRLHGME